MHAHAIIFSARTVVEQVRPPAPMQLNELSHSLPADLKFCIVGVLGVTRI